MFELLKKIDIYVFFIALTTGILFSYLTQKPHTVIVKYPTSSSSPIYKEDNKEDKCYKYIMKEIKCPRDMSKITDIPQ